MAPAALTILPGQVFGRCTVLQVGFSRRCKGGDLKRVCLVRCLCGTEFQTDLSSLTRGHTKSCGCLQREKITVRNARHGQSATALYKTWIRMRMRCQNQNDKRYPDYGGRGITVCYAWDVSFEAFRNWAMTHGYAPGLTIERRDVNGRYGPENCCFIPMMEQAANKRNIILVSCWGETKSMQAWARDPRCVVRAGTLRDRLRRGWPPEKAFTVPSHRTNGLLHLSTPQAQD